jgi:lipopolysaccharide transport system ATP-binding protein
VDRYLTYENEKHAHRMRVEQLGEEASGDAVARPSPLVVADDPEAEVDVTVEPVDEPLEISPQEVTPGTRWSTGEVNINGVTFLDGEGQETTLAQTGEPFTVRIHYDAVRRLEGPVFGLALFTENGTQINGPNTRFWGLEIPFIEGSGYVDYHVAEMPLLAGRYDVTVAVTGPEMADIYDHHHRAYSFYVQPTPGLPERWGTLYIPAQWSFHPEGSEN